MPDRELTESEITKFFNEVRTGKLFNALKAHSEEKTKPSLHDLCISELSAQNAALKEIIIKQGIDIKLIKEKLGMNKK